MLYHQLVFPQAQRECLQNTALAEVWLNKMYDKLFVLQICMLIRWILFVFPIKAAEIRGRARASSLLACNKDYSSQGS